MCTIVQITFLDQFQGFRVEIKAKCLNFKTKYFALRFGGYGVINTFTLGPIVRKVTIGFTHPPEPNKIP